MLIKKNGSSIIISDIINNQLKQNQYIYYTKKESIKMFKEKFKKEYELQNQ